jgi:hypothetical protein
VVEVTRAQRRQVGIVLVLDLAILAPEEPDRFTPGDVRRVMMARSLDRPAPGRPTSSMASR